MLFDTDKFIEKKWDSPSLEISQMKPPNNKVSAINLPKLAPDRKIVPIKVRLFLLVVDRSQDWKRPYPKRQIRLGPSLSQSKTL
jgi:hypothetical protein